jgi:hypothetical protein
MAQAICTRYLGPTNTQGSRIKAFSEGEPRGVTVNFSYGAPTTRYAHMKAVAKFKKKFNWKGKMACGSIKEGYCCVFKEKK